MLGVLATFTVNVQALVLETNAEHLVGGSVLHDDPQSDISPASITSTFTLPNTVGSGIAIDGSFTMGGPYATASNDSGAGAVAAGGLFYAGNAIHEMRATSRNTDTVINDSGATQEFFYDFTVNGPGLYLADFAGTGVSPGAPVSRYDITVLVDGLPMWESSAILEGGLLGHSLTESGTDLGGTYDAISSNLFGYRFGDYSDTISLGIFNDGDSFVFETVMSVSISAFPAELGGLAFIGDPGNIVGMGGNIFSQTVGGGGGGGPTTTVVEPGTYALLGVGLLGLLLSARRTARAS